MSTRSDNEVKIVIIDTEYVETDERSFKDVVQRLTGKTSVAEGSKKDRTGGMSTRRALVGEAYAKQKLSRDWSFKEFETLISECPISSLLSDTT